MAREYSEEGFLQEIEDYSLISQYFTSRSIMVIHTLRIGIKTATKLLPKSERL